MDTIERISKSVLLIIDSKEIEEKIRKSILTFKHVYLANDVLEAKDILKNHLIDAVIIDLKKVEDEIETATQITSEFKGIVIVALDGVDNDSALGLLRAGIDDFLPRNFDVSELERTLLFAYEKIHLKSLMSNMKDNLKKLEQLIPNG